MRLRPLALALLSAAMTGPASAETYTLPETAPVLKPAKGMGYEATQTQCLACHSSDYIATQPPGKGAKFWEAEVTKMIKVYAAPIDEADGKAIAAYLAENY